MYILTYVYFSYLKDVDLEKVIKWNSIEILKHFPFKLENNLSRMKNEISSSL